MCVCVCVCVRVCATVIISFVWLGLFICTLIRYLSLMGVSFLTA